MKMRTDALNLWCFAAIRTSKAKEQTMLNFIIVLLAMLASGAIGFFLARDRYLGQSDQQLHVLGSEIRRMRRRARDAEAESARSKIERDRMHKARNRR